MPSLNDLFISCVMDGARNSAWRREMFKGTNSLLGVRFCFKPHEKKKKMIANAANNSSPYMYNSEFCIFLSTRITIKQDWSCFMYSKWEFTLGVVNVDGRTVQSNVSINLVNMLRPRILCHKRSPPPITRQAYY